MTKSRIDCRKRHPRRHGDRYGNFAISPGAIAECALGVRAPAIGYARTGYRTGMRNPCANRRNGYPRRHGDGSGDQAIGRRSITDLTDIVLTPTIHRTRSRQGTGMISKRINRCKGNPSGHGDRYGGTAIGRGAIAECAINVQAPTIGCTST